MPGIETLETTTFSGRAIATAGVGETLQYSVGIPCPPAISSDHKHGAADANAYLGAPRWNPTRHGLCSVDGPVA